MAISKVVYGGRTLIDLTGDDVTADKLLKDVKAHGKNGEQIVGSCPYDADTSDATATAAEILKGKTAYKKGAKVTGSMINRGGVSGEISDINTPYSVQQGYHDGSGKVGIAQTEKEKIIPENIRLGTTILGVVGEMTGTEDAKPQVRTVTPSTSTEAQHIFPEADKGYNYLSEVVVEPIPYVESADENGGIVVTIG